MGHLNCLAGTAEEAHQLARLALDRLAS
jgi:hypothetical protein